MRFLRALVAFLALPGMVAGLVPWLKGTLAPWDPPKRLVRVGLYRFVRSPMYVDVLLLVSGWALFSGSPALVAYFVVVATAFHARVTLSEEPWLARSFPDEWQKYSTAVPRWLRA